MHQTVSEDVIHQQMHLLYALDVKIFRQANEEGQLQIIDDAVKFVTRLDAPKQQQRQVVSLMMGVAYHSGSVCKGQVLGRLLDYLESWAHG
jgi:hypothetical protein